MKYIILLTTAVVMLSVSGPAFAGSKEEVAAATQSWIDAMNNHNQEQVAVLYDPDAVLWGTRSPTLRDNPVSVNDYFKILRTVDPSYKVAIGEQRIRVYGDIAINTGTYTFSEVLGGKENSRPSRFTFVYRHHDGRWQIVDHHSSALPSPAP